MSILKTTYDSKDDIPNGYEGLYSERDGKFELSEVEGVKTQGDFDRFETAMKKRLTDATDALKQARDSGLTRDGVRSLFEDVAQKFFGDGKGSNGGDGGNGGGDDSRLHDLERRVTAADEQIKTLTKERDEYRNQSNATTLDTQLTRGALAAGVEQNAVAMLTQISMRDFELNADGKAVVKLEPSVSGVTPDSSPEEYFKNLSQQDEFRRFWPASKGGGADGSGGGGGGNLGADNPFSKAGWNKTKQGIMYRDEPEKAKRLMEAAGVNIGSTKPNR